MSGTVAGARRAVEDAFGAGWSVKRAGGGDDGFVALSNAEVGGDSGALRWAAAKGLTDAGLTGRVLGKDGTRTLAKAVTAGRRACALALEAACWALRVRMTLVEVDASGELLEWPAGPVDGLDPTTRGIMTRPVLSAGHWFAVTPTEEGVEWDNVAAEEIEQHDPVVLTEEDRELAATARSADIGEEDGPVLVQPHCGTEYGWGESQQLKAGDGDSDGIGMGVWSVSGTDAAVGEAAVRWAQLTAAARLGVTLVSASSPCDC